MSRLIVKNLPTTISEQKIRDLFGQKGEITDVQLKHKDGKFRKFGFVGYKEEASAAAAAKFYDSTFIGTSKIKVELCAALGDESKPKSWSKHAKDSELYKKNSKQEVEPEQNLEPTDVNSSIKKSKNATKVEGIIGDRKNDPIFQEFMKSHAKGKLAWKNDVGDDEEKTQSDEITTENTKGEKLATKEISDKDYMKHLMDGETSEKLSQVKFERSAKKSKDEMVKLFTVKIRNLPNKVKREELVKFFRPSKAHSVRIPRTAGFAYVGFKLERDMQASLNEFPFTTAVI